jgi:hypothetical protein
MWPIPARSNAILVIGLQNGQLSLSSFTKKRGLKKEYQLNAFSRISLESAEYHNGIIYNPTFLKNQILNFIAKYNMHNASVIFTISGSLIEEKIVFSSAMNPTITDLKLSNQNTTQCHYSYLFPQENSFAFYTYSIQKAVIIHHQLFATKLKLNLTHIIIESMAHLKLYNAIKGTTFRQTQLAHDLAQRNNRFDELIDYQEFKSILHINSNITIELSKESKYIAASLGAFIAHIE